MSRIGRPHPTTKIHKFLNNNVSIDEILFIPNAKKTRDAYFSFKWNRNNKEKTRFLASSDRTTRKNDIICISLDKKNLQSADSCYILHRNMLKTAFLAFSYTGTSTRLFQRESNVETLYPTSPRPEAMPDILFPLILIIKNIC